MSSCQTAPIVGAEERNQHAGDLIAIRRGLARGVRLREKLQAEPGAAPATIAPASPPRSLRRSESNKRRAGFKGTSDGLSLTQEKVQSDAAWAGLRCAVQNKRRVLLCDYPSYISIVWNLRIFNRENEVRLIQSCSLQLNSIHTPGLVFHRRAIEREIHSG